MQEIFGKTERKQKGVTVPKIMKKGAKNRNQKNGNKGKQQRKREKVTVRKIIKTTEKTGRDDNTKSNGKEGAKNKSKKNGNRGKLQKQQQRKREKVTVRKITKTTKKTGRGDRKLNKKEQRIGIIRTATKESSRNNNKENGKR